MDFEERTKLLIGDEAVEKLHGTCVAVFGIGGVGSFVAEALIRAGIGTIIVIDNDCVSESNINRQLLALHSTVGELKVDVLRRRALDINPDINIFCYDTFVLPENASQLFDSFAVKPDYVADCIDTVSGKIAIIEECKKRDISVISCMGTGNKLSPGMFQIADIMDTSVCPLCRVMRKELRDRNISDVKVLYSKEIPVTFTENDSPSEGSRKTVASISFVPSCAGLLIAREIIIDTCDFC